MGTPKTDPDYEHSEAACAEADAFDAWMRSVNPRHQPTDDGMDTRLLRKCWEAAKEDSRLQIARMFVERSALTWAAADETPFDKDRMRFEAEASVLDSLAVELRA